MSLAKNGVTLQESWHGKSRVRVAKVLRHGQNHFFVEYNVQIILLGGSTESFTDGVNNRVVATDTCKNHVYVLAKSHPFDSPESFALDLASRFLNIYSWLSEVRITVVERPWRRSQVGDKPHVHGFSLTSDGVRLARAKIARRWRGNPDDTELVSGLNELSVLKTTQSGWANFVQDKFTTLPETKERILATTITAEWAYKSRKLMELRKLPFSNIHERVRAAFLKEFYGPPDKGHFSPGVQYTLFLMAKEAASQVDEIDSVTLSLPNLHFLPCHIPVFAKNGIKFEDDVFIPTDEPHGIISATVGRKIRSKL